MRHFKSRRYNGSGTHWVAWYKNGAEKKYFDSYGLQPPNELVDYLHSPILYNTERVQPYDKVFCGNLCLYVLKQLGGGGATFARYNKLVVLNILMRIYKNISVDKFGRSGKSNSVITEGVSLSYIGNNFLRRDGTNTATGSINMTGNTLTNVSNPVNAQDIATKNYVDGKVSKSGDTMTGNLDMSGDRVMNVPFSPTDTSDAVNAAYVVRGDLYVEQKTVLRYGTQAMTGNLDMDDHYINNLPHS